MHEPRLNRTLRELLNNQRVAALGSLNADGSPFVSMVPFAIEVKTARLVIHVSLLAPHTRNLQTRPRVSFMVMQAEAPDEPVHALHRVTLEGLASLLEPGSPCHTDARAAYLTRFPEAQPITQLGDFSFVAIEVLSARQVAGFGSARPLDAQEMAAVLRPL